MTPELFYSIIHVTVNSPDRKKITSMEQYMDIMDIRYAFERACFSEYVDSTDRAVFTSNDAWFTFNVSIHWSLTNEGASFWARHLLLAAVLSGGTGKNRPLTLWNRLPRSVFGLEPELEDLMSDLLFKLP